MSTWREGIRQTIEESGLQIIGVFGDSEPTFTYTIGVSEKHGFELICVGLASRHAACLFNQIVREHLAVSGNTLDLDVADGRWANSNVMFKACNEDLVREYAIQAFDFYDSPRFVQMVMSDREGRLPGEEGFDSAYMEKFQPLLYRARRTS